MKQRGPPAKFALKEEGGFGMIGKNENNQTYWRINRMAQKISFDFSNTKALATDADVAAMKERVIAAKKTLVERTGEGNDFLGGARAECPGHY